MILEIFLEQKTKIIFKSKKNTGLYDFGYFDTSANLVEVIDKKNNKLKLTFDKNILKYFWIFQSQGGWNQHNVLVLEPCTNGKK